MSTVILIGRLLLSLAAVLLLMWFIARRLKGSARQGSAVVVDVLGRSQLSRTSSVAVVRVLDQAFIVGITDAQVSLLGETDLEAAQAAADAVTSTRRSVLPRVTKTAPRPDVPAAAPRLRKPALAGSALSAGTWRQTVETLRDLTARNR